MSLPSGGAADPSVAAEEFRAQASAAGLVVPTPQRPNLWVIAGVALLITLSAIAVGVSTGWLNPRHPTAIGYSHPARCSAPLTSVRGALWAAGSGSLGAAFQNLTDGYFGTTGSCIGVTLANESEAGSFQALDSGAASFALVAQPPSASDLAGLSAPADVAPVVVGSIDVIYNPTGLPDGLQLSPAALSGIYRGTVTSWQDPLIAESNPGSSLAGSPAVSPAYPAGPSSVDLAFSGFLARSNATWNATVGAQEEAGFPAGASLGGPAAVASFVAGTSGAIGIVDGSGAGIPGVDVAAMENAAGAYVVPSAAATSLAAASVGYESPAIQQHWSETEFGNASASAAYPLAQFGFVVVFADVGTAYAGNLSGYDAWWMLSFLEWATNAGQSGPVALGLAALPASLQSLDAVILSEVSYNGTSVLTGPSEEGGEGGGETGEF